MRTLLRSVFSSPSRVATICVLAIALLVAGCGGGGGGGSAGVTPPALNITTSSLDDGVNGTAYSQTLSASGGSGTRTWSLTSSSGPLPDGLSLSNAGVISGTPTVTNTFDFTVQVQDSSSPPQTDTQNLSIRIADELTITTTELNNGSEEDTTYGDTVASSGGTAPFTWSVAAGTLPTGLSLDGSTTNTVGFTGDPSEGGRFDFSLQVTDSGSPAQSVQSQSLRVLILQVTTTSLPHAVENDAYSATLQVAGQIPPVTWSEPTTPSFNDTTGTGALGTPCEGLTLDFNTGVISGTPVNSGACGGFTIRVDDSDSPVRFDTQALAIDVLPDLVITTASLPPGTTGQAYNQTVQASGGVTPYTWSEPTDSFDADGVGASTTPCEGLLLDFSTGTVSGTPVNAGDCGPFTLQVADSGTPQQTDSHDYTISVAAGPLTISTPSLPAASVNRTYLVDIDASGGTPPLTWSEPGGALDAPATPCQGLLLDVDTGEISGTPVNQGTCGGVTGFTINVQDSLAVSDSKQFTIEVGPEPASGRNDTVATATDYTAAGLGPTNGDIVITASISPFGPTSADVPNAADNDFYKFTAQVDAEVLVEVTARGLATFSGLDPVVEIVRDDGSLLGQRVLTACSSELNPTQFTEDCMNDDILAGINRDSRLTYMVASGGTTFYVRVLDWRGDARPDFIYELHIKNAD